MAITITAQDIEQANSFLAIEVKASLSQTIAELAIEKVEMKTDANEALPPMWKERRGTKELMLMGIFCRAYLNKDFKCNQIPVRDAKTGELIDTDCDYFMTSEAYNEWAGSHIFNQLDKLKKDKSIADKVYDILDDFYAFRNMVNGEIRDIVEEKNDVVGRLSSFMKAAMLEAVQSANLLKKSASKSKEQKDD